jgi:hypothetical protein
VGNVLALTLEAEDAGASGSSALTSINASVPAVGARWGGSRGEEQSMSAAQRFRLQSNLGQCGEAPP